MAATLLVFHENMGEKNGNPSPESSKETEQKKGVKGKKKKKRNLTSLSVIKKGNEWLLYSTVGSGPRKNKMQSPP